jgi:hypothetical protein
MYRTFHGGLGLLLILALGSGSARGDAQTESRGHPQSVSIAFEGSQAEAERFMAYYDSIQLTAAQEAVRQEALQPLPAPCCSSFSAATCCCECNLSRTIWGLSKFLIAREDRSAGEVRAAVTAWIGAINPSGYPGNTCFTGGCGRSFKEGGCGGMRADQLTFE